MSTIKQYIRSRLLQQCLFWLFIFAFVFDYFFDQHGWAHAFLLTAIECGIYMAILYTSLFLIIPKTLQPKRNYLLFIAFSILLLVAMLIPYQLLGMGEYLMDASLLRSTISFSLNFILFTILAFLYWYMDRYELEKQRSILLENEKLSTELDLLKSQISPHFLFNSLNNIYHLSLQKSDDAPVMVEKLSDILRYLIYESKGDRVPLRNEINLLEKYLEIQRIRKIKAIDNIHFSSEGVQATHAIAPMILINFLENSFKHGDLHYHKDGFLKIVLQVSGEGEMKFHISNSKKSRQQGDGVGLSNTKKQLDLYYPNQYQLDIQNTSSTFTVNLTLNVKKSANG